MTSNISKIINKLIDISKVDHKKEYSRISKLHKYWSRKPWFVIEKYIDKYSKKGDSVLDPFCGSGIIGAEAVLKERNFIGYDLNPVATFISENTLENDFQTDAFNDEFKRLEKAIKEKLMSLYEVGDEYCVYAILGAKNEKPYNCVLGDYSFGKKKKVNLAKKILNPNVSFPKNLWFPDKEFPKKFYKDRFSYKGIKNVSDMFTKRNLLALAILFNEINKSNFKYKKLFLLGFTNTLLHVSKLKAENVRPLSVNNYWVPDDYIEENVWWRFADRVKNIRIAKESMAKRKEDYGIKHLGQFRIHNESSLKMKGVKSGSVNYVFTDPPYGEAVQYSELSFVWNCWLEKNFNIKEEVIINPVQNKGFNEFNKQMESFISETHRVLKDGGYFTLCFQNKDVKIWLGIVKLIKDYNFKLVDIDIFDTFGNPYNKNWAKFSPKSDFYVTFQKNKGQGVAKKSEKIYSENIVKEIVAHLEEKNGIVFDLNKGYDLFVAITISKLFASNSMLDNSNKLNLKDIILMFSNIIKNGNLQERLF